MVSDNENDSEIAVQFVINGKRYNHVFRKIPAILVFGIRENFIMESFQGITSKMDDIVTKNPEIDISDFIRTVDTHILSLPFMHYGLRLHWEYIQEPTGECNLKIQCEQVETGIRIKVSLPFGRTNSADTPSPSSKIDEPVA
jgi:hypothetical protein